MITVLRTCLPLLLSAPLVAAQDDPFFDPTDRTGDGVAFLEWELESSAPRVGQVVSVRLRFGVEEGFFEDALVQPFRQRLDLPVQVKLPNLKDAGAVEWLDAVQVGERSFVLDSDLALGRAVVIPRDDRRYVGVEITRGLRLNRAGRVTLPAPRLHFASTSGFREDLVHGRVATDRQDALVLGEPLVLEVVDLPEEGRPPEFSGAVGRFEVWATVENRELAVGETMVVRLEIEGEGQLGDTLDRWPDRVAGFQILGRTVEGRDLRLDLVPLGADEAETEVIRTMVREQQELGLDLDYLHGAAAVREVAPALSETIRGASFCPTDGHADPVAAVTAFAAAARRAGADIREGVRATRLVEEGGRITGAETSDGVIRADAVVVAAGVHTPELLAPLGLTLPLAPTVVCVLQTVPLPPLLDQVLGVANADCAGRQQIDGRLRVTTGIGPYERPVEGWTAEDLHPSAAVVGVMNERISAVLPAFRDVPIARLWGGLIDMTPDALPVLDTPAEAPGLVVAAGFSGHGFALGPVTGQIIADLALGRTCRHPIAPFRLGRFNDATGPRAELTLHG